MKPSRYSMRRFFNVFHFLYTPLELFRVFGINPAFFYLCYLIKIKMEDIVFAITDVETTGGGINGNKITEICIVLFQNGTVKDKFVSLVNPEVPIPAYITALTGIDDETVENAPVFADLAETIDAFTKDAVFVAHNVGFDYNVLRNEFRETGIDFTRKKLCTVRLSRKLIPNLLSYSLGRLCNTINIPLENRHRAEDDTDATVILFSRLLALDENYEVIQSFLNRQSKEATLPPHISREQIDQLPERAGVYLFKNKKHRVLYAGKAKNIKKRVLQHFYEKKNTKYKLGQEAHYIDFEITNNELLALLIESEKIRRHYPKFNRAQKKPTATYQIIHYVNRRGIIQLGVQKTKSSLHSIATFYRQSEVMDTLEKLCESFRLCPRFCSLQQGVTQCSHYKLRCCEGICEEKEAVSAYNKKVEAALESLKNTRDNFVIQGKGRTKNEMGFALVLQGTYQGYGFIERNNTIRNLNDFKTFLVPQPSSYHTDIIIRSYLKKNGVKNVIYFDNDYEVADPDFGFMTES